MRRVVLSALTLCALVGGGAAFAGTQVFSDVPPDRYFSEPVTWAYENEITFGVGDGRFAPDGAVTRGQNVTFAWRYDQNVVQPALDELRSESSQAPSVVLRDGDNTYPAISLPTRFNNPTPTPAPRLRNTGSFRLTVVGGTLPSRIHRAT